MTFIIETVTRLRHVGTNTDGNLFTITLEDGTELHGTAIWPRYPSYTFALDPDYYPDEIVAALEEAREKAIEGMMERQDAMIEENPNVFNEQFMALTSRERAELTVDETRFEVVITSKVQLGHPEVIVKVGYPYQGKYFAEVHYRSPIADLSVDLAPAR